MAASHTLFTKEEQRCVVYYARTFVQGAESHTCMCTVWGQFCFSEECIHMDRNVQEELHSVQDTSQHQPVIMRWKKPEPWFSGERRVTIAEIAQKSNISQGSPCWVGYESLRFHQVCTR